MLEFIQHQLATNQLFGGGLILMLGGGLIAGTFGFPILGVIGMIAGLMPLLVALLTRERKS